MRRLCAALPVIEDGNAELFRLVGEIAGDAGARKDDDAGRHDLEHAIVTFEGRGLAVKLPVGLESDLRDLALVSPAGGSALGAFRRAAMDQHHIGVLGEDLVEHDPDALVIGVIDAAGKQIFGPFGSSNSASALRRAAMKSRLSIMAAVRCL